MLARAEKIYNEAFESGLTPDPLLTVSEWSDQFRFLPQKASAEPGKWRTSRTPFLKEIMDCLSPSSPVERVVFMKGGQLGGTECGNNWIGFIIHMAPGPLMCVQPTVELGKRWSRQRMAPMIEETPALRALVKEPRERDSGNTVLSKEFKGGVMIITGANSAVGLRSMPVRFLFLDEIDGYPHDVEGEGDPVALAEKRASTFARRKIFLVSTPTVKGVSRIEREYDMSDQRKYFVPCPFCGHKQWLQWGGIIFERDDKERLIPESVAYKCESCEQLIPEHYKTWMLDNGEWRPTNPEGPANVAGFHLSSLYSPIGWKGWIEIVKDFLEAKKNTISLKTWVNTVLGECWEEQGEKIEEAGLYERREVYGPEVPSGAAVLTCGVDIQDDRIEAEIVAWGKGEESWSMAYKTFYGSPAQPFVWEQLDEFLQRPWKHESGIELKIISTCIDSAGHFTKQVYEFCKRREFRRIFAIKGSNERGKPLVSRPTLVANNVKLFHIGTDAAKETIYARLKMEAPGAGFMHFPMDRDEEYFKQLTAEKIITKYNKGFPYREWVKIRTRNEGLDVRVYAMSALAIVGVNLDRLVDRIHQPKEEPAKKSNVDPFRQGREHGWPTGSGGRRNWVKEW